MLPAPAAYDLDALQTGVEHIYQQLMAQPEQSVWFIATGPLTNVGVLLTDHPDVVSRIKGVSIMGGAIGDGFTDAPQHRKDGPGNWSAWAEFNIMCDPEAAKIVLEHEVLSTRIILVTLDLSHQCRGNAEVQKLLFGNGIDISKPRIMMSQTLNFFAETYRQQSVGMNDGPPLHDPIAVFAVTHPDHIDDGGGERWRISVVTEGEQTGRTVLTALNRGSEGVTVPRRMDVPVFWNEVDKALSEVEKRSPLR